MLATPFSTRALLRQLWQHVVATASLTRKQYHIPSSVICQCTYQMGHHAVHYDDENFVRRAPPIVERVETRCYSV